MSRAQIKEGLFGFLSSSASFAALLGSATASNFVIYTAFPQHHPLLASYEPASGWVVIEEKPTENAPNSIIEEGMIHFHCYVTRLTLADDVIDVLDNKYQFTFPQESSISFGTRILINSKRVKTEEVYEENIKMYRKTATYQMRFALDP